MSDNPEMVANRRHLFPMGSVAEGIVRMEGSADCLCAQRLTRAGTQVRLYPRLSLLLPT
jgi:hypothetical protein